MAVTPSPAQGRDMRPPFRLIVKLRRFSWLPAVWPNLTWITMESPPDTTWQAVHDLGTQFKEAGALVVQIQSLAEDAA